MTQALSFARDWSEFFALEFLVAAAFLVVAILLARRLHPRPAVLAHVEVFLRPESRSVTRSNITIIQRNYFHRESLVGATISQLGGEVLGQLNGGPLIATLPPDAIPKLLEERLVDRVETSRVVSLKLGRRRS